MHISWDVLSRAGMFAMRAFGAPGAQGAGVTGTQGMGVSTPSAAVVAAATAGLAGHMHIPKDWTFTMDTLSMMFAAGTPPVITRFSGVTTSWLGATPKLH
jgi:hypothetical protein